MRILFCIALLHFFSACEESPGLKIKTKAKGTPEPELFLLGQESDSVFLFRSYNDPGLAYRHKGSEDYTKLLPHEFETTGFVDTRIPGSYTLRYRILQSSNRGADFTRTVVVRENSTNFLNGHYQVSCTCTLIPNASGQPTISANSYTAIVMPGEENNTFELSNLYIGPVYVSTKATLTEDSIQLGYFSPYYHQMAFYSAKGRYSRAKPGFSLHSVVQPFYPRTTFYCENHFTRKVQMQTQH